MQDEDPTLYYFLPMNTQKGDVLIVTPTGNTFADKTLSGHWSYAIAAHLKKQHNEHTR